ncbi:MAG: hypothetical protein IKA42_02140 [Clostridia bacterium]|nr:hypothetical protein [Clostridia bacterium]
MKSKLQLFSSIFKLIIGIMAIIAFVIIGFGGENMVKWIVTLVLAIACIVMGIIGIVDYKKDR